MAHRIFGLVLCLLLAGCAGQPNGSHSFNVVPEGREPGVWMLDGIAGSGRIEMTLRLRGNGGNAAYAALKFNRNSEDVWTHDVSFDDRSCRGAYTVSFTRELRRERLTEYFETKLPWEETARLRLEWRSDGRFVVTVNGREQKVMESVNNIRRLAIEVSRGEIVVDDLTYTKLASNAPFLPPEPLE